MKIEQIDPFRDDSITKAIVRIYQAAFAGPPWNETWAAKTVLADFHEQMARPEALCLIAKTESGEVVGFAWGYQVTANAGLDTHLEAPNLHQIIDSNFFYLDECAIVPGHQSKGVGKALAQEIFGTQKQGKMLLRTKAGSPMRHIIEKLGGCIIQHISKERVIMALS